MRKRRFYFTIRFYAQKAAISDMPFDIGWVINFEGNDSEYNAFEQSKNMAVQAVLEMLSKQNPSCKFYGGAIIWHHVTEDKED